MKLKWQIPALAIFMLVAGCSKEDKVIDGELMIEDIIVGEGTEAVKHSIVTVNKDLSRFRFRHCIKPPV